MTPRPTSTLTGTPTGTPTAFRLRRSALALLLLACGVSPQVAVGWPGAAPPTAPAAAPAAKPEAPATEEFWYAISLGGKHAGYQRETRTRDADGTQTTAQEAVFVIRRGTLKVRNRIEASFTETKDHTPISMRVTRELGSSPVVEEYTFRKDAVEVISHQDGRKLVQTRPRPSGEWLTPAQAENLIRLRQTSGAKQIVVRAIDPSVGLEPSTDTYALQGKETLDVLGKKVPVWKYALTSSKLPGITQTVSLDERARLVRVEMDAAGDRMETIASTREAALRESEGPEIMVATFVKPDRPIREARRVQRAAYTLSVPKGELPDLPTAAAQTFTRIDAGSGRVEVDVDRRPITDDGSDPAYLAASSAMNTQDEEIRSLSAKAVRGATTPTEKAAAVRRFVRDHIREKNLGSGFATASEVARSRSGDCTEHAVLAAALLRSAGVPARVASGLVYADQFSGEREVFAYHMWAQAFIEQDGKGTWIDVDATLPESPSFDATHIALVTSSLKEGEFERSMVNIAKVLGVLKVKVERTETARGAAR